MRVVVAEPDPSRAALAQELGAELTLDPTDPDMGERLDEMTGGLRADVVFEASGKPSAMAAALDLAGFRARLVYIGIDVGGSAPAALGQIQSKELQVRGIIGSPGVWPQTLRFLARSGLDLSAMVTERFDLEQAPAAYEAAARTDVNLKVHIQSAAGA